MIFIYEVLYIKELDNINEIFKKDSTIPLPLKYIIYIFKKLFCVLTIKNNNICVLPYKRINNNLTINIITKIIKKSTNKVVLSNYLNELQELYNQLYKKRIYIYKGKTLPYYLIDNIIDYICKIRREDTISQEVHILLNNLNELSENSIIYLSQKFKRINIVTPKIKNFIRITNYLESLGIAITVTNNKRKSLLKAKFIVNFDFDEELLNLFNINTKAIIIQMNKETIVKSKLFNGINILGFQISYNDKINNLDITEYKKFDKKVLYEKMLDGKKYEDIINMIQEDNIKIVNLIGRNGIINNQEYLKI